MIQSLSSRHSKKIASLLFLLFYAEFFCSYKVFAGGRNSSVIYSSRSEKYYTFSEKNTRRFSGSADAPLSATAPIRKVTANIAQPVLQGAAVASKKEIRKTDGSGPGQPEMQSFQSVNTNNMVDLFSGDFSYNIPLLDVGGYPVNLHYRSGITMDQEASWVGLGWNINPGTITRNMRGIPDDFEGNSDPNQTMPNNDPDIITKTFNIKKNWTAGANVGFSPELFGYDLDKILHLGLNASLFYNNYKGIGSSVGLNASISGGIGSKGSLTGGLSIVNNSQDGISISPSFDVLAKNKKDGYQSTGFSVGASISTRGGLQAMTVGVKGEKKDANDVTNTRQGSFQFSPISFLHQAYTPTIQIPFTNFYASLSVKGGIEAFGFSGMGSIGGYYTEQFIAKSDRQRKSPAYGYLYLQNNKDDANAILDFNREKELTYRESPATPHLAIPIYTHDIYSISGEGTGGMFRPYRSDIGYVTDQTVKSKNTSVSLGLEIGGSNIIHGGGNIEPSISSTASNIWTSNNELKTVIPYKQSDGLFESVYFRNPSEKTINAQDYYTSIGDADPMLPLLDYNDDPILTRKMQPYKKLQTDGSPVSFTSSTIKSARDKRTQVISYLNAFVASSYALDKTNLLYPENAVYAGSCDVPAAIRASNTESRTKDFRKAHHLSEITVLNNDGRRYTYGLPVYNKVQDDVNFSVDKSKGDISTGLVTYDPGTKLPDGTYVNAQNSPDISVTGTDNYYSKEEIPAYAHSFMLTAILSPDYVDRLGDGITDDDQGDAVKFNYSRIFGNNNTNFYKWRTPFNANSANYNEGLKTDARDDRGNYIYGEKEVVYLNSVESKTMIAVFTLNDPATSPRQDGYQVIDENGGINTDPTKALRYLTRIDLYAKSDLLKNKATAKPIKTVYFEYGYDLCKNNPSSVGGAGKLTLKKVWFNYYNNQKGKLNPYVFYYHPTDIINNTAPDPKFNPGFHPKKYDRWGNYKDFTDNPNNLDNADYPYATQDAVKAANNASAWTLTDIRLPSGGRLNVNYESDDYAYVQNKRAAQMTQITGFGNSSAISTSNNLYQNALADNHYVFVKVPEAVQSKDEVLQKYLDGMQKLYFRLRVKMPSDIYGSGNEQITTYARIEDYGVTTDANTIWIKLQGTGSARPNLELENPLATTALQMLRLNLPSKAYPGSDVGSDVNPESVIRSMIGFLFNFSELFSKYRDRARVLSWAKEADLTSCFVRLNNPGYKKYGGGLRVKSVMVYDNWMAMTQQKEATYGQEYDYTTTKTINGVSKVISSGVASYEPTVGNEENPFRQPIEYNEQIAPLAPVNNMYSEEPLGEAYFPSAGIGYSKVRTHSIHAVNIKSATGFEESEFYTTYDFPTLVDKTVLDERKYKPSFLGQLVKIDAKRYLTQAQGFAVETNDMDGKPKATASYPENDPTNALSYTKYYYQTDDDKPEQKHLNNTVSVVNGPADISTAGTAASNTGTIKTAQIGKSIEMVVDFREQKSVTRAFDLELNGDGFIFGIVPVAVVVPYGYPQYEENRYRSVATLKLVQRYGILNKVEHFEKGSKVTTENMLYDSETGEVALSKVQNEFNDPVYSFNYPAHWAYSGMGLAYQNIGAVFNGITLTDGKITVTGGYTGIENYFESGDEVMLTNITQLKNNIQSLNCDGEITSCAGVTSVTLPILKAWAVTQNKVQKPNGITGLRFIDENGKLISTSGGVTMTIIRSGKRNMATSSIGTITSLASPLKITGTTTQLVFDNTTKVVNAAATSYNDFWKVEDAKYKPAAYQTATDVLQTITLHPVANTSFSIIDDFTLHRNSSDDHAYRPIIQTPYYQFSQRKADRDYNYISHVLDSWLKFDFSSIPAGAKIINAQLRLYPHFGLHNETRGRTDKNHDATNPHRQDNGTTDNEGEIRIDKNPLLNTVVLANLRDNDAATKSIFSTSYLDAVANRALIRATNNQPGYVVDAKALTQAVINDPLRTSWLRLRGTDYNSSVNRLCFWSTNSSNSTDCSLYLDNPPVNTVTAATRVAAAAPQTQALAVPICTTCSTVDPGAPGKNVVCNTTPELTIEYVPACAGLPVCGKYYCQTTADPNCTSYILDTTVNPYRFGILGNWRMNRAYTYFDTRAETNPSTPTNIRDNGVAANFIPYWNFNTTLPLQPATDTVKWVWNSEMTRFNRKGFEIENHDPLGRYNSVQYGYKQTLPVAVSQNARYTEQAFEGFEDLDYDNSGCVNPCPLPRHFNFVDNLLTKRTTDQAHTGKYSIQLNPGETVTQSAVLNPADLADTLWYKIDTTKLGTKAVTPKGKGLRADYYRLSLNDYVYDRKPMTNPFASLIESNKFYFDKNENQLSNGGVTGTYYFVRWQGALQVTTSGDHTFSATSDNTFRMYITIDGKEKLLVNNWPNDPLYTKGASGKIYLKKGQLYPVRLEFNNGTGPHNLHLMMDNSVNLANIFYPLNYTTADTAGSVKFQSLGNCINPEGLRAKNQIVYNEFMPAANNKYVISAWVKEQAINTTGADYKNVKIQARFFDKSGNLIAGTLDLKPTGTIIEGWQRIEEFVTIPQTAASMSLVFMSLVPTGTTSSAVYFDDVRVHPFNTNMKSFVYNPVDIKLMAELDENNYASFYEYDEEGTLIRVKKETERGIKTIKETRSALIKQQ